MTHLKPKSTEDIQAQVAAFSSEHLEYFSDRGHVFNNVGTLALDSAGDVVRTTSSVEYINDPKTHEQIRLPEGTKVVVATAQDYTDYLRGVGGSRHESIAGRAEVLKKYSDFEPVIAALKEELADSSKRSSHPQHLGSGSGSSVFLLAHDGSRYAVRLPKGEATRPDMIDNHVSGAVLGKGIPHLEQIIAASYKDGVTIAEVMPGVHVGKLTLDQIRNISDDQLRQLIQTVIVANERGIEIDPKPSNILYDPKTGFGIIDYLSSKYAGKRSPDQDVGAVVGWMASAIYNAGFFGRHRKGHMTAHDYKNDLELLKANLGVLTRFKDCIEKTLKGDDLQQALVSVNEHMQTIQSRVKDYSDAQWVKDTIAKTTASNEMRTALLQQYTGEDKPVPLDTL